MSYEIRTSSSPVNVLIIDDEEGAFDFIKKPFKIGDLCKLIDRAMTARKQP